MTKVAGDALEPEEFVRLVQAVAENQEAAKMVEQKVGYVLKKKDGALMLHFFKDKATAESWEELPGEDNQPLCSVDIPESGEGTVSYRLGVDTDGVATVESSTRDVAIRLRVTSRRYDPIVQEWTDTREQCTITIQRQVGEGAFETVATLVNQNTVAYEGGRYMTLKLKDYLDNGEQTIRVVARGYETGETNSAIVNVTVAEMSLSFGTRWEEPFVKDDDDPSTGKVNIGFKMRGSVNKELNYEFYNAEGVKLDYGKIEVGTAEYDQSNFNLQLNHPGLVGIYRVKAWLNYANSSIETAPVEQNVMLSVKGDEEVLVVVNNVESPVVNWSSQHVMDYAVWNPTAQGGESDVALVLKDTEGEKTWMTTNVAGVKNGVRYDYSPYLSIENYDSEGQKVKLFATRLHMMVDGVEKKVLTFSVDNTNDFAPTVGANFVLIPSMRSNNDTDRTVIRNESALETEPKTIASEWNGVLWENDGWVSVNGVKMLRMLAGTSVRIPYECYSNKTKTDGLTMEVDLAVRNIADEEAEVLTIGKMTDGGFVGLKVTGRRAVMYKAEGNVDYFQDIEWQEGERTHVAVNIMPRLTVNGRDLRVVRMFINGKINREFTYTANDNFWDGVASNGIVIGGEGADVDVYGMRVFKDKMVASSEVLNDYVASLSDVDKKLAIIEANNIMEGGVISYRKAKGKYNVLVWKGRYPSKLQQADTVGDLMIDIVDDPAHSGVINAMSCKGQGSSSKKYLLWNGTFAFGEDSVWVDGNGNEQGAYYQLTNRSPRMTKTVGKLNWASSMQSHKMGLTAMYQDLYDDIFDGTAGYEPNGITTIPGYENTRIAVEEKAFLFFVQEDESKDPVYYGNMTWGSAKGDKLTFGYDKTHEQLKNYLMLEGSDQTPKLTLYQVPWFADEVTYNETEEYYQYNGFGSWDVTLGNRESVDKFIEKHNFVYSYSTRLRYWNGNLTSLQKADEETADRSYQYFIVGQSYGNFDVYRYDWLKNEWVDAGATKDENGTPVAVNLNEQLGLSVSETDADFEAVLATFKAARVAKFREGIGRYVHVNDFLFTMQFLKFVGASDNRAKNTYEYYDPVIGLIRQAQDDLDTVLPNNNQGQKQKPYWVEEHDFDARQMFNGYFWAGSGNAMYNTFEDAYGRELRQMMAKIMASMARLGGGNVMGCWERYFFAIQDYFPAVAYNECARLWYEYAKTLYDAGEYTNDTDPITQSLGDLKECEKEWVKNRILYMASYCEYASALGESIEFRQTNSSVYRLTPAMKMYVYMGLGTSSVYPVGYNASKRTEKGEEVVFNIVGSGDSIQTEIRAVGLLESVGDLSRVGVTGSTNFSAGKRLASLKLGDANASVVKFNPSAVNSFPENAVSIDMTNCGSQLTQIGGLTNLNKLEVLKAKGTGVTVWVLPQNNKLKTVELPDGARTLDVRNQMNLENLDVDTSALQRLTMGNVNVDVQAFVEEWLEGIGGGYAAYTANLSGVRFRDFSAENMVKLARFGSCVLEGVIDIDNDSFTQEQVAEVQSVFGGQIASGKLVLNYRNYIALNVTPAEFDGQYEVGHIVAKSINKEEVSLELRNAPADVYIANKVVTETGGGLIVEADIRCDVEVSADTQIGVIAKSASVQSDMFVCTLKRIERSISISGNPRTIRGGIGYVDITATVTRYVDGNDIVINFDGEHFELVGNPGIINFNPTTGIATRTNKYRTLGANGIGTNAYVFTAECTIDGERLVSEGLSVRGTARNTTLSADVKRRVDGELVDAEYYWLTEKRAYEFEVYPHTSDGKNTFEDATDTFEIAWRFVDEDECEVEEEGFGDSVVYKIVKNGLTIATMPKYPNPNDKSAYRNNVTMVNFVNEADELRTGKDYDFSIQATLKYTNTTEDNKVTAPKPCVAHPEYFAVQSYDTTQPNYNPAVCIILEQAGLIDRTRSYAEGGGMYTDPVTGNQGLVMTMDQAGVITDQRLRTTNAGRNCYIFSFKTTATPTNISDCVENLESYIFDRFNEFRYFTSMLFDDTDSSHAYRYGIFCQCRELVTIRMPKTITRLAQGGQYNQTGGAFQNCSKLNVPVTVFDNIIEIVEGRTNSVFGGCVSLTWERLPLNLSYIRAGGIFNGCTNINIHSLGDKLAVCNSSIPGDWSYVPDSVQSMTTQSPKCTILSLPNTANVNNFAGYNDCPNLEEVVFRGIEEGCNFTRFPYFVNCPNLTKIIGDNGVVVPEGVTTIGSANANNSWVQGSGIRNIVYPSTYVTQSFRAHANAVLKYIRFKAQFLQINEDAVNTSGGVKYVVYNNFRGNRFYISSITYLVINSMTPPEMIYHGLNQNNVQKIIIPNGSIQNYAAASVWSSFTSKFIEYDFDTDPAHLLTATSADEVDESQIPTA